VAFIRAVAPRQAYALHDGLLSEAGFQITNGVLTGLARCPYERLAPGTTVAG
jgi:hypothetical protein